MEDNKEIKKVMTARASESAPTRNTNSDVAVSSSGGQPKKKTQ